jgi:hypothetical protein
VDEASEQLISLQDLLSARKIPQSKDTFAFFQEEVVTGSPGFASSVIKGRTRRMISRTEISSGN